VSRTRLLWLGLVTVWPLFYAAVLLAPPWTHLAHVLYRSHRGEPLSLVYAGAVLLHLVTIATAGGLLLYYLLDLSRTKRVVEEQRLPWALLLLLTSVISMPIYWYLFLWRQPARISPEMLSPPRH
jgi:hypothetical protein